VATPNTVSGDVAARAVDVWKVYGEGKGDAQVNALAGVSVEFARAQYTAIMGPSGSGKSTLMQCMAGLDSIHSGQVWIGDTELSGLGDKGLTELRRDDRLKHRPTELSGGQQQRVACARALLARPEVIFADEPTGNLDSRSGTEVLSFLRNSVREFGQTIIMVTHDPVAASYADRVIFLADGQIVDEMTDPTADAVLDRMKVLDTHHLAAQAAVAP
jgi:putative ABC transport system ATP-binding protein